MSESKTAKQQVTHNPTTEWRGEKTWRAVCPCGWRGPNGTSGATNRDVERHRRDVEAFADSYGVILQPGDQVRVKLASFDGPLYLIGEVLFVKSLGRTKVTVTAPKNYGEHTWAVTAATLELVERAEGSAR